MCHWALDSTIRGIAVFGYHNFCSAWSVETRPCCDVCLQVCLLPSLCSLFLGDEWRLLAFFSGAYICLYQYLDNILFGLHDSRNERSCGAAVIYIIFVYIVCFWCAFPTRYPLSCLIYLRISYVIYSSHSHPLHLCKKNTQRGHIVFR